MEESSPRSQVTIRDIADALGLSRAAISLGLRNSPQIAPATCRRIQAKAQEMGYQPNLSAYHLAHSRRNATKQNVHSAIAWLNCWKDPAELRKFRQFEIHWQSARQTVESAGYRLEEFVVDRTTNVSRLQNILLARNIPGIIIPPHGGISHWSRLCGGSFDWSKFASVRIGHSVREPSVNVISPDQVGNGMLAFEKMRALGYERIGFVTWRDIRKSSQNWFIGGFYIAQLAQPTTEHVPPLFIDEPASHGDPKALGTWLKQHRPDAILTEHREVLGMLETMGLHVPRDIGFATLNTLDGRADAGIYQNPEFIGKATAEVLMALINRNERGPSADCRTTTIMGRWQDGLTLPPKGKAPGA